MVDSKADDARASSTAPREVHRAETSPWTLAFGLWVLSAAAVVAAYWGTVESAVTIWWTRPTYGHTFAVLPIAFFVAWLQRDTWLVIAPTPSVMGWVISALFAGLWFAGAHFEVMEAQHFAISGMLVALAISLIGLKAGARLWLPLAYLFLLAPSGTPILPLLRDATMWVVSGLFALSGIDSFIDGYEIQVRVGHYFVAPGCAGLNFFLATLTIGPVYCVLMYHSVAKQMIALAIALLTVVVTNGIRIFGIIAIAEATKLEVDISADHLFYGWAFFSLVLVALMGIGTIFADPLPAKSLAMSASADVVSHTWADRAVAKMVISAVIAAAACCGGLVLYSWSTV